MFPAGAVVMFPSVVPAFAAVPAGADEADGVPVPAAFEDGAGAVEDGAGALEDGAPLEDDAGASGDRDEPDADNAEADKDWLAEQPTTARAARTANAGATLTVIRRAMPSAGAHGYRVDAGQRRPRDGDPLRFPYGFLAIPQ
jgi:hypothetical protein